MASITVPVPEERTAEFYEFFGVWLAGKLSPGQGSTGTYQIPPQTVAPVKALLEWGDGERDFRDAKALWRKYSPRARKMFGLLIDNPDREYTGEEIAEACDIPNGAHGVAGVLAWPGRHGRLIRRELPSSWRLDPDTLQSVYWMPAKRAEMFKAVRAKVEAD